MKNNIKNTLDDFLNLENDDDKKTKKVVREKSGLIERVNRILVTPDGRQLLRENY